MAEEERARTPKPATGSGGDDRGGRDRDRGGRDRDRDRARRRRRRKGRPDIEKMAYVDFKDVRLLRQFLNDRGCIVPRRQTGLSARAQRILTMAIKRAREMALLPFVVED